MTNHFRLSIALLALLSVLAFLPGLASVPPIDRDEPRYVQATKQMVESGNFVDIRLQDEPRYKKPIGIYWLQALAVEATGADGSLWAYRLPSLVGAVLAVLGTVVAARTFLGRPAALAAGFLTLSIVVLSVESHLGKTDAALLGCVVWAQAALARIWMARPRPSLLGWPFLFWVAVAAGVLVKGPIVLMVSGLTIAWLTLSDRANWRWLGRIRWLPGLLLLLALVLPWFVAIHLATDGAFFQEAVMKDFLGKAGSGQEGHWAPPFTHLVLSVAVAWPVMPLTVAGAGAIWAARATPAIRFLMAWAVPSWIVFEIVSTKLPHYTLPLLPALSIAVAAIYLEESRPLEWRWLRWLGAFELASVAVLLFPATIALPLVLGDQVSIVAVVLVAIAAVLAVQAARRVAADQDRVRAVLAVAGAGVILNATAWGLVIPNLKSVWLAPRIADATAEVAGCPDPRLVSVGYREMSLVFLAGTDTLLASPEMAADAMKSEPCAVLAVVAREKDVTLSAMAAKGVALQEVGQEEGVNIANGKRLDVTLYRRATP
ncbi:ArnT family glycosyltransferase [Amorphus sp. 3PC139-8]|uniref:ArnT family glycosyltransferase n=1 Tax=Amorphus sp. 3PC139-8 TaxID=2735676 RepID=UPI00345DA923